MKLLYDITEAEGAITELSGQLGHGQISRAMRLAINDTMRRQRTKLRQYVRKGYNIPSEKINTINFRPATDYNLTSEMGANRKPVQLAYFKPVFAGSRFSVRGAFTKKKGFTTKIGKGKANAPGGVSVEIKKGAPVSIPFAFMVPKFETPFVFARGQYQKGTGFVTGKPRNPIALLSSASVYGAAFGSDRLPEIEKEAYADLAVLAETYLQKVKEGVVK